MKFSIQRFFNTRDDDGKIFRATAIVHIETLSNDYPSNIKEAYLKVQEMFPDDKLGTIIPGHHLKFP